MDEQTYMPTNREKAREPKGRSYWCGHCDRCLVAEGAKCWHCGGRDRKRHKSKAGKPTPLS